MYRELSDQPAKKVRKWGPRHLERWRAHQRTIIIVEPVHISKYLRPFLTFFEVRFFLVFLQLTLQHQPTVYWPRSEKEGLREKRLRQGRILSQGSLLLRNVLDIRQYNMLFMVSMPIICHFILRAEGTISFFPMIVASAIIILSYNSRYPY